MSMNRMNLDYVLTQKQTPVAQLLKGTGQKLIVRLPYAENNRDWLQNDRRSQPKWIVAHKHWELPKSWFDDFVKRALQKYGKLYIIQSYRAQEKCSPSCQNAINHECQCSCMGRNHGAGNDGSWFEVSDAFSTRWGERELACRLMIAKNGRSGASFTCS